MRIALVDQCIPNVYLRAGIAFRKFMECTRASDIEIQTQIFIIMISLSKRNVCMLIRHSHILIR